MQYPGCENPSIHVASGRICNSNKRLEVYIMRNLLVVVDMQNDFVDGSLGTKEAVAIVDHVVDEIGKYETKAMRLHWQQ
mgnify:FL=1